MPDKNVQDLVLLWSRFIVVPILPSRNNKYVLFSCVLKMCNFFWGGGIRVKRLSCISEENRLLNSAGTVKNCEDF